MLMFRRRFRQLSIFPEDKILEKKDETSNFKSLLSNYEAKIKFLIIFIISLLIVYSIGIERGKRSIQAKKEKELIPVKDEEIKPLTPKEEIQEIKGYVIQVATYKKDPYAEKEALNLKKKGFSSFTKKSGDFIVVYVGSFQSKDEAQISLKKLKKHYSDCFIRKL